MFNSNALQWVIAFILIGYVIYNAYRSIKVFGKYKKLSAEFKRNHTCETYGFHMYMVYLLLVFAALCLLLGYLTGNVFAAPKDQLFYYRLAYVGLAIVFVGQFFESMARRTILFAEDGMFYVDTFYRFRMITSYEEKQGSISRQSRVLIGGDEIVLPHAMAVEIQNRESAWKAAKKAAKKIGRAHV